MWTAFDLEFRLADFGQNTRSATSKAEAAAYVELVKEVDGNPVSVYGVGIDIDHHGPDPRRRLGPQQAVIRGCNLRLWGQAVATRDQGTGSFT